MRGKNDVNETELHLAMIGHELRNVLSGVVGLSDLLNESGLKPEQAILTHSLRQSAKQMHWLIEAVGLNGEITRFPTVPRSLAIQGVDLLEQAVRSHTVAALQKNNYLLLDFEPSVPRWWHGDGYLLRRLLDNLLVNAIRYNSHAEIMLKARCVEVSKNTGKRLELTVRDSGPAIAMEVQRQMFRPRLQRRPISMNDGGAGLGLYLCHLIVSGMRGTISYCAEGRTGNCFTVSLPDIISAEDTGPNYQVSAILQSMVCRLSLPRNLCSSTSSILARLGIRQVMSGQESHAGSASADWVIDISDQYPGREGESHPGGLFLILVSPGAKESGETLSKWLPMPLLESTLCPALMEMALERLNSRAHDNHQPG